MTWHAKIKYVFLAIAAILILVGIYMAFIYTPAHGEELFTLESSYKEYLDEDGMNATLLEMFKTEANITLSGDISVEKVDGTPISDTFWRYKENDGGIITYYRITDTGDELVVSMEGMGDVQRIFYFHVAHAWVSYVAFMVTLVTSLMYLKTKKLKYDRIAAASAGIGVIFCGVAIVTGCLWAKGVWGVYWRWEDFKLNSTLVLWLVFIAYMVLRVNVKNKSKRANLSSVFGILGALGVPLSFGANRIWNHYHPTVVASSECSLQPSMGATMGIAVMAFTFLYLYFMILKIEVDIMKERTEDLKQEIGDSNV